MESPLCPSSPTSASPHAGTAFWVGRQMGTPCHFEFWGPSLDASGEGFFCLFHQNPLNVLAQDIGSWISFSGRSESEYLRIGLRSLYFLDDFNAHRS